MRILGVEISKGISKILLSISIVAGVVIGFYPFFEVSTNPENIEIVDGDTLEVRVNQTERTVRLKGVDTPETEAYNTPGEFKGVPGDKWRCLEDWGYEAKDFVEERIENSEVVLEYRKSFFTVNRGSYGRLIGRIHFNGSEETLGKMLVEKGYARSYGEVYLEEEKMAREDSRGLWEDCSG